MSKSDQAKSEALSGLSQDLAILLTQQEQIQNKIHHTIRLMKIISEN